MKDRKISIRQLQILVILDVFGVGVISLPRIAAEFASNDGWLLIIGATLFALAYALIINTLGEMFPYESFMTYSGRIIGRPIGNVLSILLAARIILSAGIELRIFSEITGQTMLYKTPLVITSVVMAASALYVALAGYEARARLAEMLVFVVLMPLFITYAIAAINVDYTNILPAFKTQPSNLIIGSFYISFAFRGVELTLLVYPLVDKPQQIKKGYMKAIIAVGTIMLLTTTVTLLKFGPEGTRAQLWPVIQMMDAINLPGKFFERLDAFVLSLWVISVFISISGGIFFPAYIFGGISESRMNIFVLPSAVLAIVISQLPGNVSQAYTWLIYSDITIGIAFMLIIPMILLVIAKLRRMGERP